MSTAGADAPHAAQGPAEDRLGVALILCAPSGAGKTTLVRRLLEEFPRFSYSVSCTTRAPRGTEKDGVDYHFLTPETFSQRIDEGYFAEWAEVHGNYYGTPLAAVRENLAQGRDLLFDIDVQGARQLRENLGQGAYVFILPPSRAELEKRLRGRGTDAEEAVLRRLTGAAGEIAQADFFDAWVVNDDLTTAYDQLRAAFLAETLKPAYRERFRNALLAQWEA